jgi:hypothetical protein
MAAFRRPKALDAEPEPEAHESEMKSLIASAARIRNVDGQGWRTYRFGDDSWQQEVWRLYDIIGELRFAANWIGSACSRVRIYVAEVDKNGRVQQETKKPKVAAIAENMFGSPAAQSEALRMLGINLTIAGDCYIVGRGAVRDNEADEWYIVSCSELKRWNGNVQQLYPDGTKESLDLDRDIVIRVWTPHPRRSLWADSPTRAAMPMLWEIERLTRYVFAQIDSRLISAGMVPIPKEASFPDDSDDVTVPGAEGLTQAMMKAGSRSLKGEGTAAGVVPMFVEVPMDALGKIEMVTFGSELSKQALDLRAEAIRRFALAMDIAPEILTGTGDANHWSAWHVEEANIKIHIEPLMTRICDALTSAYLEPALKTIKEDPDRYVFWFDTAPLTVRPERLKDALNLNEKGIISDEAVILAGDFALTDKPSVDEDLKKFTRTLMERDPTLFQIPAVRKIAGYTDDILPPNTVVTPVAPGQQGAGPPPPPAPPTGIQPTGPAPMPQDSSALSTPGGPTAPNSSQPPGITASATTAVAGTQAVFAVANMAVLRALEVAGKRLVGNHHRTMQDTPAYSLHTRVKVHPGGASKLLTGAWDQMPALAEFLEMPQLQDPELAVTLHRYCSTLLEAERPHEAGLLWEMLSRQGFLNGES